MGNRWVDGVLRDVSLDPCVIVIDPSFEHSTLHLHFVRGLPRPDDDFTDSTHGLGVRGNHRKCA